MDLSIIIPAYNADETLHHCLKAIKNSSYKDFELIVVDDASTDATLSIAKQYADKVIRHQHNQGQSQTKNTGVEHAKGDILLFIDADIVIKNDAVLQVVDFLSKNPDVNALTGLLSVKHPNTNFFSQYKNLYMNFIFKKLPERVNFIYGSIHAIRRKDLLPYGTDIRKADDTALGQKLVHHGKKIAFLKDLEVIHHKKYGFSSFIKNDFRVPFDWAKIFIRYKGWKQLGKNKTGYAHSPKEQLASVILAPLIVISLIFAFSYLVIFPFMLFLFCFWYTLNHRFLVFLTRKRGLLFGFYSLFITFFDHIIMASGICVSFLLYPFSKKRP